MCKLSIPIISFAVYILALVVALGMTSYVVIRLVKLATSVIGTRNKLTDDQKADYRRSVLCSVYYCLRRILYFSLVLLFWRLFEEQIRVAFDAYFLPFFKIKDSWPLGCIAATILFFAVVYFGNLWKNRKHWPINYLLASIVIVRVYVYYRISGLYVYDKIECLNIPFLDIVMFFISVSALLGFIIDIDNAITRTIFPKEVSFKESDLPENCRGKIKYGFNGQAKSYCEELKSLERSKPWSIALNGIWGEGKSTMLNSLETYLKEDGGFLVIRFNPNESRKADNIQEDFFNTISRELKKYSYRIDNTIEKYISSINVVDKSTISRDFQKLMTIWGSSDLKKKINEALLKIPYRVVVFIDDMDRLDWKGCSQVLKLIGNNASFNNVIFITACDLDFISKMWQNDTGISSQYDYLSKYFNLVWELPLINKYARKQLIKDKLKEYCGWNSDAPEFDSNEVENRGEVEKTLEKLADNLTTIRDIKIYVNSLMAPLDRNKVKVTDYLLVNLVKHKWGEVYNQLKRKDIVELQGNVYHYKEDTSLKGTPADEILKTLFPNNSTEDAFEVEINHFYHPSVRKKAYFDNYFLGVGETINYYQGLLSEELQPSSVIQRLKEIEDSDAKQVELADFLVQTKIPSGEGDLKVYVNRVIQIVSRYYSDTIFYSCFDRILKHISDLKSEQDKKNYKTIVQNSLLEAEGEGFYLPALRQKILLFFIDEYYKENEELAITQGDVLTINKNAFRTYVENSSNFVYNEVIVLFYSCIEKIDPHSRKVTLDRESCRWMRTAIEKQPGFYWEKFIRPGMVSAREISSIAPEPFWRQIFSSDGKNELEEIDDFIKNKCQGVNPVIIKRVETFLTLYKANNYEPVECSIPIKEFDSKIDDELEKLVGDLNNRKGTSSNK